MINLNILDYVLLGLNEESNGWKYIQKLGINFIYPQWNMTALALAVYYEKEDSVCFLLDKGADPNIYKNQENAPIVHSLLSRNIRIFTLLLMFGAHTDVGGVNYGPKYNLKLYGAKEFIKHLSRED